MKNIQKKLLNELISKGFSYFFIVICYVVGFFPWLNWIKYHISNHQYIMAVLDVVLFFIITPINGFIIIVKTIFSLFY